MKSLAVWMNSERVSTRTAVQGKDQLPYDDSWLQSTQARPLSLTLAFTPGNQSHSGPHVGAWFDMHCAIPVFRSAFCDQPP